MYCDECGAVMHVTCDPITEMVRGTEVTVEGVRHYACSRCGNVSMDLEAAEQLSRKQFAAVSHSKGLLSPEEIRELRKGLGLTQKEFERVLGVSSPTVSRWETGTMLPSKVACNLIRVLSVSVDAFTLLCDEQHGVKVGFSTVGHAAAPVVNFGVNFAHSTDKAGTAA